MKKILILLFSLLNLYSVFSAPLDLSSSVGFSIPVDEHHCMIRNISSVKYNYGLRLNLDSTVIAGNAKLSSTKIKDLYGLKIMDLLYLQDYTYGLKQSFKLGELNVGFLAGTLKYSNSISRLKTPAIACPSPLKSSSTPLPGINPSLPSASATKSSFSWAAVLYPASQECCLPAMQLAVLETGEKYVALYKKTSLPVIPEVLFSFTGATVFHDCNIGSGWFQNEKYYRGKEFFSGEFSLSMNWKQFKTSSSSGLYEHPFGGYKLWIRNQSFMTLRNFSLGMYIFNSDEDLLSASGTTTKTFRQIFISPQFRFWAGPGIAALGITAGEAKRKTKQRLHQYYEHYYLKMGGSYKAMNLTLNGNCNMEYSTETMKQDKSYGISTSLPLGPLQISTTFNFTSSGDDTKKIKITEKIFFRNLTLKNIGASWTWTENTEDRKWNIDADASFSHKTKKINMNGRLSFTFQKLS